MRLGDRVEAMGRESILRLLFRFSVPAIIAMEASAGYELFDAVWCGRLSAEALAGLTVSGPLMAIYRSVGLGIGVGCASLISRKLGAGEKSEADHAACNSISLFFIVSCLVSLICLAFLEALLRLFGASDNVLPYAYSYMLIETCSMPIDFSLVVFAELVRTQGTPSTASVGLIVASVADLIWSPILVFGFGPFPALGIAGAAWGTLIGRVFGVALLVAYLAFKSIYEFKVGYFKPDYGIAVDIDKIGASSMLRVGAVSVSQMLACRAASSFGTVPLATLGVLFRVQMIVFSFCIGLGQGLLPLVGFNFGAKNFERVRKILVTAGSASFVWGTLWCALASLFPKQILMFFSPDPVFLAVGAQALGIFAINFLTMPEMILSSFFQGIGKALESLVVSSSRTLIFLIPCLIIMPFAFGLTGLWASYPAAGIMAMALALTLTMREIRKMKRT